MKLHKYKVLLILFIISLGSSLILVFNDLKPLPLICDVTEGCYIVKNSTYNSLLFGIPNEYLGLIFFSVMTLTALSHMYKPRKIKENAITGGVLISFLFALYSLYLQEFIIGAYCRYCTLMDISIVLSLLVLILFWKK
ncbi:MAG TPA: vitamin K epoxide reductase family protein [Candidatus Nanoarchaeia archaeon]|nr:vitamin K epoxide reductase family protein [Candidatus Nanoarchaeia archaeon]